MTVYIKKCPKTESFPFERWIRSDVNYSYIDSFDEIKCTDFVIISKDDIDYSEGILYLFNIIVLEEYCEIIKENIVNEYEYHHEFFYLKYQLEISQNSSIDTVISGNSYAVYGIENSMMDNSVNISIPSQDIYYSTRLIYKVLENNDYIKRIILIMPYNWFFSDLSKVKDPLEKSKLYKVYKPILGDVHNCVLLHPRRNYVYESNIFDVQRLLNDYITADMLSDFFNRNFDRESHAMRLWDDTTLRWNELMPDQKKKAALCRTQNNNTLIKRKNNYFSNSNIFREFVNDLYNKGISVISVVPPATLSYRSFYLNDFKDEYYYQMSLLDGKIKVYDMFSDDSFSDNDFVDMDHLNAIGAVKFTTKINEFLFEE